MGELLMTGLRNLMDRLQMLPVWQIKVKLYQYLGMELIIYFTFVSSGAKDAMFNAVNHRVDRFQTNQVLKADKVDLSKVRLR
jgi:hypothetical protein